MRIITIILMALKLVACAAACHGAELSGKYEPTGIYAPTMSQKVQRITYAEYAPWYENGHATSDSHLINSHGVSRAELAGLSQAEKDRLHGKMHGEQPRAAKVVKAPVQVQSGCPQGGCPINTGVRFFRRR